MAWLCMQEDFEKAAEEIKAVNVAEQNDMLELYGLFKQANMGDNTTGVLRHAVQDWLKTSTSAWSTGYVQLQAIAMKLSQSCPVYTIVVAWACATINHAQS